MRKRRRKRKIFEIDEFSISFPTKDEVNIQANSESIYQHTMALIGVFSLEGEHIMCDSVIVQSCAETL